MRAFDPRKIPVPPDFRPLALSGQPLVIEIGCGVGFHPLRYARAHPGRQVIAFERTKEKFEKFARRLERHDPIPNLQAVRGDAVAWITHGIPAGVVDQYFILYPNPYPKESQRNLRFPFMPFFGHLVGTMKKGGRLTLATNIASYREEAEEAFVSHWGLRIIQVGCVDPLGLARTHFEKKYLARGETCWNLEFERTAATLEG